MSAPGTGDITSIAGAKLYPRIAWHRDLPGVPGQHWHQQRVRISIALWHQHARDVTHNSIREASPREFRKFMQVATAVSLDQSYSEALSLLDLYNTSVRI